HSTAQHSTAQHSTAQHSTAQHSTAFVSYSTPQKISQFFSKTVYMKNILFFTFAIFAIIILSPQISYGQKAAPQWINEAQRSTNYPSSRYYIGFSQDVVKSKSNADVSLALKSLERDAQSKMAESIIANVESRSVMTASDNAKNDSYKQTVQVSTAADLVKTEIFSYHDIKTNKIYALAAVKKSDLADYYVARIEFFLDEMRRGIALSKQLFELDKRKESLEKLEDSENYIDSTASYRMLLITVDTQNGLKRSQGERANELLKEIAVIRAEIQAQDVKIVFVTGAEIIQDNISSDIIISGLQTLISDNNITITENEKEASFVLKIEGKICNWREDGYFHYANACVKAALINVKTGKNEVLITVNGKKEGGLTAQAAGELAFKSVVSEVWAKIKDKMLED
ncbi:MAG: hypothetical protein FWF51_11835, partial [Chitinivibrionia bacterium]|nr:hypothetical protein [Chitinivibrionia bacterium]